MDLTDENINLSASYDQSAFGNVLEGSQSGYHLTTKEFNQPISLYYFFMRWYEPKLGRYITKDPLPNMFPYLFCSNNPMYFVDESGLVDTIKGCFVYTYSNLLGVSDWFLYKITHNWALVGVGGGAETIICFCHWIATAERRIEKRILFWEDTTVTKCPKQSEYECEEEDFITTIEKSNRTTTEYRYCDIPLKHPIRRTTVGFPGDEGKCICPTLD